MLFVVNVVKVCDDSCFQDIDRDHKGERKGPEVLMSLSVVNVSYQH